MSAMEAGIKPQPLSNASAGEIIRHELKRPVLPAVGSWHRLG
jgi:hypothetical protein